MFIIPSHVANKLELLQWDFLQGGLGGISYIIVLLAIARELWSFALSLFGVRWVMQLKVIDVFFLLKSLFGRAWKWVDLESYTSLLPFHRSTTYIKKKKDFVSQLKFSFVFYVIFVYISYTSGFPSNKSYLLLIKKVPTNPFSNKGYLSLIKKFQVNYLKKLRF